MLTVVFDKYSKLRDNYPGAITDVKAAFNQTMQLEWFDDPWVQKQIYTIDHHKIPADVGGLQWLLKEHVAPVYLSNGLCNLIMAKFVKDRHVLLHKMGPNCNKPLLELSNEQDIKCYSSIPLNLPQTIWDATGAKLYAPQWDLIVTDEDSADTLAAYVLSEGLFNI